MKEKEDLSGQQFGYYRLIRKIGGGQFGDVYLAENLISKAIVAIKILHSKLDEVNPNESNPDEIGFNWKDFIFEVRVLLIEHPNIVRVRDFDIDEEKARAFIAMDYVPHGNLRARHPRGSRVSWDVVASYAAQIAQALQAVHDQGIVHRDVKPENLLVGQDGKILLSDFGIAVPSYTLDPHRLQLPKGTPFYIAPEQINQEAVRQSDQYSLGAVMYEWLTGTPPFVGTFHEVVAKQLNAWPVPPRQHVPALPAAAEELIMRMLEKEPEKRFASMREFGVYLERIQSVPTAPVLPTIEPISRPLVPPVLEQMPEPPAQVASEPTFTPVLIRITRDERENGIRTVAWSPNGQYIASAGTDKTVVIRHVSSGTLVYAFHGHTDELWSIAWSPDSKYIASGGLDRTVQLWEATTGYSRGVYMGHSEPVRAVAWSADGKYIASAGDDKTVQVWDSETGMQVYIYTQHNARVYTVAWSPTRPYVASGGTDAVVHIWSIAGHAPPLVCRGHVERVMSVAWSPDGEYIASGSDDRSVRIWHAATSELRSTFAQHQHVVSAVAWSPDGQRFASGSWDKTVRIWAIDRPTAVHTYMGHESWVNAVDWSPDGQYLVTGSWDTTSHIISVAG